MAQALPSARFSERHFLDMEGSLEQVWVSLSAACWGDLRYTTPLMMLRGLGQSRGWLDQRLLGQGPVTLLRTDPPSYAVAADIGRPWQLRPELGPTPATMQDLIEFSEPGWLKYGMDFALHALDPGRIRVTTTTLCEPTGEAARRRFRPYWTLIRPFSGLIRRDMLQAVARGVGEVPGRCDER